jgi:tetratricopeptide (TPR) repeat protein
MARTASDRSATTAAVDALCDRLLSQPPAERRLLLAPGAGGGRRRVVRRLLGRAHALRHRDPARGLAIARVALEAVRALRLPPARRAAAADLRAEVWGQLGNHLRLAEDYPAAEGAFRRARALLARGSGDSRLRGRLLSFEASLRREQRRFAEAAALLAEAADLYDEEGDPHRAGEVRLQAATVQHEAGDPEAALALLCRAGEGLDYASDPQTTMVYLFDALAILEALGQPRSALRLFAAAVPLFERLARGVAALRLHYLAGRLAAGAGSLSAAEEALRTALRGFLDHGLSYDAALVALDLALVWTRQRKAVAVAHLARDMYPVFVAREIPREASAALLLFVKAAEDYRASAEVIAEVRARLAAGPRSTAAGPR